MNEEHPYRATIPPVLKGVSRPLWSVMIPTYNCADYLRETLASVLAQDPGADMMQIQVVDDRSTQDDPAAVVEELGRGRVEFYQQPQNVGYIKNFATCLQRSRGHRIHLLHGDDCVRDGFYRKMQGLFEQYPEIGAAFCRQIIMDDWGHWQRFIPLEQTESGILNNWLERIATELTLQTPAMVVRREVYEQLGGFDCRMKSCGEDWEMWVRIAAQYSIGYEVEPLVLYRDRSNSITKRSIRTGQNIRDVRKATEITRAYLPPTIAKELSRKARESWADWAFYIARQMIAKGDLAAAMAQIREGLLCSHSLGAIALALPLIFQTSQKWLQLTLFPSSLFKGEKNFAQKEMKCHDAN
jgi:cellulose synthase/poly-beta-1,6-N-acetylglucosamine synthase-like glycosyltransferase